MLRSNPSFVAESKFEKVCTIVFWLIVKIRTKLTLMADLNSTKAKNTTVSSSCLSRNSTNFIPWRTIKWGYCWSKSNMKKLKIGKKPYNFVEPILYIKLCLKIKLSLMFTHMLRSNPSFVAVSKFEKKLHHSLLTFFQKVLKIRTKSKPLVDLNSTKAKNTIVNSSCLSQNGTNFITESEEYDLCLVELGKNHVWHSPWFPLYLNRVFEGKICTLW